jgi:hypothetical protein
MRPSILLSIGLIMLLGGCLSPQARQGRVLEGKGGDSFPDFTFMDQEGRTRSLRQHLGDFTVLAFTQCGGELHESVSGDLTALVKANQEPGYADTVGYDIHWCEDGCKHADRCHLIEGKTHLFSICDARSVVRDLYEARDGGQLVVIGPDRRIALRDSASNMSLVKGRLQRMFDDHAWAVVEQVSPDE